MYVAHYAKGEQPPQYRLGRRRLSDLEPLLEDSFGHGCTVVLEYTMLDMPDRKGHIYVTATNMHPELQAKDAAQIETYIKERGLASYDLKIIRAHEAEPEVLDTYTEIMSDDVVMAEHAVLDGHTPEETTTERDMDPIGEPERTSP